MKTNRIFFRIAFLLFTGVLLASCNNFLDELPDNRTEVDTPEKVGRLLVSAYAQTSPALLQELMSDNMTDTGANIEIGMNIFPEGYLFREISSSGQDSPYYIWIYYYGAVSSANLALQTIDKMEAEGHDMSAYRGEALMCRAYAHFMLCNTFCQAYNPQSGTTDPGIPYMEELEVSAKATDYPRGTVARVYEKIAKDIEAGFPLIEDELYSVPKYHFTKKAAAAFAANFFLYYGEYQKSIDYADIAIGENPVRNRKDFKSYAYTSALEYANAYCSTAEPSNFLISAYNSLVFVVLRYRYSSHQSIVVGESNASDGPWNYDDPSKKLYHSRNFYFADNSAYFFPKIAYRFYFTDQVQLIGYYYHVQLLYSLEKTLVDRAEAHTMLGNYSDAATDLSLAYTLSSEYDYSFTDSYISNYYESVATPGKTKKTLAPRFPISTGTQENLIHACLHIRRVLTTNDGTRLQDIKRYGIAYTHYVADGDYISIEPFDKRLAIQLPSEVIANGMEPNPR